MECRTAAENACALVMPIRPDIREPGGAKSPAGRATFHGLRKYGAVWFAMRGCSAPEIAAWGGWKSLREVERYIRAANQRKLAGSALARMLTDTDEQIGSESVKPDRAEVSK